MLIVPISDPTKTSCVSVARLQAAALAERAKQPKDLFCGAIVRMAHSFATVYRACFVKESTRTLRVSYNFRITVNLSDRSFIDTDLAEIKMTFSGVVFPVYLRSACQGKSIKDANQLALAGEGFDSESDASEAGIRCEEAFMIALAKGRIGVDFGDSAPKSEQSRRRSIRRPSMGPTNKEI